jgi:hypothetical protein
MMGRSIFTCLALGYVFPRTSRVREQARRAAVTERNDPLNYLIEYALKHSSENPDIAEDVLERFCDFVASNRVPDARILEYLEGAFRQILDGKPAAAALNLVRTGGRGKKRRRTYEHMDRQHLLAARAVTRCRRSGMTEDGAVKHVASILTMGVATVQHALIATVGSQTRKPKRPL